nr:hypothetical protein KK1_001905 [Ipomoea batatas]
METGIVLQDWVLNNDPRHNQENQATGGDVIKGSDGIKHNTLRSKENLNHDQSSGLKCDGAQLQNNSPEGEGIEEANGDDGFEVEIPGHGNRVNKLEDAGEEIGQGRAEGHVDQGEGDRVGPVVHLAVKNVLIVDDDGKGEEDPDGNI